MVLEFFQHICTWLCVSSGSDGLYLIGGDLSIRLQCTHVKDICCPSCIFKDVLQIDMEENGFSSTLNKVRVWVEFGSVVGMNSRATTAFFQSLLFIAFSGELACPLLFGPSPVRIEHLALDPAILVADIRLSSVLWGWLFS